MRQWFAAVAGLGLRMACALALVSLALHLPAEAGARQLSSAEIAAYTLPDGSLPALCVTVDDGTGQGKIVKLGIETLALHKHAALLPSPDSAGGLRLADAGARLALAEAPRLRHLLYPPGAGPRAPPHIA